MGKSESLSYFFLKKLVISARSGALVRRISLLSFLTITLSISAFFIVLFVMNGMNRNIRNRILALEPHLTTVNNFSQNQAVLSDIKASTIIQYQKFDLIIRTVDGQFRGSEALGYSGEGLNQWFQMLYRNKNSRLHYFFSEVPNEKIELGENEVAIGVDLARSLSLLEGDEITLIPPETLLLSSLEAPVFQKVVVKKILVTDLYDLDSRLVMFNSERTLKRFSNTLSRKTGFQIWFDSISEINSAKQLLVQRQIESETWNEKNSDLFFALMMEKGMISTFLGLAGLIASSSILTVLALLMSQKKHDIAIIKTLGLSQKKTLMLFVKIGLWISLSAITLGTLVGVGVSLYIQYFPVNVLPQIYYDSTIPAFVDFNFVGIVLIISAFLAFFGAYIPARATLKIEPAILLRQKN